jgi:hypothetical protein
MHKCIGLYPVQCIPRKRILSTSFLVHFAFVFLLQHTSVGLLPDFCPVPIVRVMVFLLGFHNDGNIAPNSYAAKLMKQRHGYIRRDSFYALAQLIGSNGFGDVRLIAVFFLGAGSYLPLEAMLDNPIFACSLFIILNSLIVSTCSMLCICCKYPWLLEL